MDAHYSSYPDLLGARGSRLAIAILGEAVNVNKGGAMGLIERVRNAGSPKDVVRAVSDVSGQIRGYPLYQHDKRIASTFQMLLPNLTTVINDHGFTWEISGSVLRVLSGKGGGNAGVSATTQITPLIQAMMLEDMGREAGKLVDLGESLPHDPASLLEFTGPGHVFRPGETIESLPCGEPWLNPEAAAALQSRRERYEADLRYRDTEGPGVIAWVAQGVRPLAAFASVGHLDPRLIDPPFRILATLEAQVGETLVLSPLIIWHIPQPIV
jgi:hypothetical protein